MRCSGPGEDDAPEPDVVDQDAAVVGDVDPVDRLAVLAVAADVVERAADRPVRADGYVVRRHEPANAALGVAEELSRFSDGLGREQVEQPVRDLAWQLREQVGSVVGREVVQELPGLLVGEVVKQSVLVIRREVREDLGGQTPGERAEEQDAVRLLEVEQQVRELRLRPLRQELA
jgi:hypothetical protein